MKKLNRKGFTLVELLAVIIILAIVVAITIPAVTSTIATSRRKAGESAAQVVANWVDEQYALLTVSNTSADSAFTGVCGYNGSNCKGTNKTIGITSAEDKAFLLAAGLKLTDVTGVIVNINNSGRSCVTLNVANDGSFFLTGSSSGNYTQKYVEGAACGGNVGWSENKTTTNP